MPLNCHSTTCEMAAFKHIAKGLHLRKLKDTELLTAAVRCAALQLK